MLKLLIISLLLGSTLSANENKEVEEFLSDKFQENPAIVSLDVKVVDRLPVPDLKDWDAVFILVNAVLKGKPENKTIQQKMVWFTDGNVITKELTNIKSGAAVKDLLDIAFNPDYYTKDNLLYGKVNAKYKVAIFSDPLCPFCSTFVPKAIEDMKKEPEKFAIYYYHYPLPTLHPASVELAQAAIAADLKGIKNVVLRMYNLKLDPKERDVRKILEVFNRKMGTDLKPSDLRSTEVQKHYIKDLKIAEDMMVAGTPTVFFNGKIDRSKRLYQKAK